MVTINVLLSGRLKLDGYGRDHPVDGDGTMRLSLAEGSTVGEVIESLGVPADRVAMIMVNSRQCPPRTALHTGHRVILIPADVAALWHFLGLQNLGADTVCDF
jgi:sulfur carrier protein ThiS